MTSFDNWFWVFYYQFVVCILLYILLLLLSYCQIKLYAKFETKNRYFKKNLMIWLIFQYWRLIVEKFSVLLTMSNSIFFYLSFDIFVFILFNCFNHWFLFLKLKFFSKKINCWKFTQNNFHRWFLKNLFMSFLMHLISKILITKL